MNYIVANKATARWRPTRQAPFDNTARDWLAKFPNNRPADSNDASRTSSHQSAAANTPTSAHSLLFEPTTNGNNTSLIIAAISVGRGHASTEVGFASMDAHSPALTLSQFSDDMSFGGLLTTLNLHAPAQLLLPATLFEMQPPAALLTVIRGAFPHISLLAVDRGRFNSQRGAAALLSLCTASSAGQLALGNLQQSQYYAMCSAAALLDHLQRAVVRAPFAERSLAVRFAQRNGCLQLDVESAHRLELLYPLAPSAGKRTSLYGVLNACRTQIGQRNLRARILQPSCDLSRIRQVHECVEECRGKEPVLGALHSLLGRFGHVDRLVRVAYCLPQVREDNFRTAEVLINQALQLKQCLDAVPELFAVLSELRAAAFVEVRESLQDRRYPELSQRIHAVLGGGGGGAERAESAGSGSGAVRQSSWGGSGQFTQRLYAVRRGLNGMLDLNRTIYAALMDDIHGEVDRVKELLGVPLRLLYSKTRSFHMQLQLRKSVPVDRVLQELDVLHRSRTMLLLTSSGLRNLNIRIDKYIHEIHFVSTAILANLLHEIRADMEAIYALTTVIAELDILVSLVKVSLAADWCRPQFGDDLRVVQATHPFAAAAGSQGAAVPNNLLATGEYNFFVITGPNMSGKTIYLKMIALLQIMAQIGSYVPAQSAQFRMCDKLFTRMGFNDNIAQNASSFVLEVREMNYILRNVTANSLVIIDELCRSTNAAEGERIALRVCQQLLAVCGRLARVATADADDGHRTTLAADRSFGEFTAPFVFFTTHFAAIGGLIDRHLNVVNLNFNVSEQLDAHHKLHLTYSHQLQEGCCPVTGYGLALTRTLRFPRSIVLRSEAIARQLRTGVRTAAAAASVSSSAGAAQSLLDTSRTTTHSRISNPINRTYRRSQTAERSVAAGEIGQFERNVYDLYANIVEVFKADGDTEFGAEQANAKVSEFLEVCGDEDTTLLEQTETAEILKIFQTTSVQQQEPSQPVSNLGGSYTIQSKWFPTCNDRVQIPLENTPSLAPSTSISKLSYHSILRRYAPIGKPQIAATTNSTANTLARNEICGFENMSQHFWASVDQFENGPEQSELRDFINDGLSGTGTGLAPELAASVVPATLSWSSGSSAARRVRFADDCQVPIANELQSQQTSGNMFARSPVNNDVTEFQEPAESPPNWSNTTDWRDIFEDVSQPDDMNGSPPSKSARMAVTPHIETRRSNPVGTPKASAFEPAQSQEISSSTAEHVFSTPASYGQTNRGLLPTLTQIELEIGLPFAVPNASGNAEAPNIKVSEIHPPPTPLENADVVDIVIPAPLGY